jgi:DNA-dependent RNA polymerase auxiliary subunit epsilon
VNELDILQLFYDEMKNRSATRDQVFLNMEEEAANMLSQKLKQNVSIESVQNLTDACIANEWLERTTADPNYKYLSLTEAGLQMILAQQYG